MGTRSNAIRFWNTGGRSAVPVGVVSVAAAPAYRSGVVVVATAVAAQV